MHLPSHPTPGTAGTARAPRRKRAPQPEGAAVRQTDVPQIPQTSSASASEQAESTAPPMTKKIITAVSPLKTLKKSLATLSGLPAMGSSGGARTRPTADVSNARTVCQKPRRPGRRCAQPVEFRPTLRHRRPRSPRSRGREPSLISQRHEPQVVGQGGHLRLDCIDAVRASARVRRRLVRSAALAEKLMAALPIPR
jgi:hypothetical protein